MHLFVAGLVPLLAGCADDFDRLVRKVEQNYAGYLLEVVRDKRAGYDRHRDRTRARAAATEGDDCYFVLRDFIAYFNDPHLFIFQSTRLDSAESARRARAVELTGLTEPGVRQDLARRRSRLDPLEGIWSDGTLRVAVVPAAAGRPQLIAVVLTSDTAPWRAGAVRARFAPRGDGGYDGEVWERNFSRRHVDARIHKRVLLRLSPGIWGKEYPVAPADSGLVDSVNPHRATIRTGNGTVVISIPSHDPAYRPALDSLIEGHGQALRSAQRLIVDLRGNEGGSAGTTNRLLPYLMSAERRPAPLPGGTAVMLSSDDQIAYVQRFMVYGPDTLPTIQRLLSRLRANPGRLVPVEDSLDTPQPQPDSVIQGPARVGIIVDGGTVSAAEAFLLRAMRSTRVTVFGENTSGALDYQSVFIVPFQAERPGRWLLGYPTITARADLPKGGIKGRGIDPQVKLDLAREADVFGSIERHLVSGR